MIAARKALRSPLVIVSAAQTLIVFNVAALKISMEAIVTALDAASSAVKTAIIAYSLVVAVCVAASTRVALTLGGRRAFRFGLAMFGGAMAAVSWSSSTWTLVAAQILAGAAAAALASSSVVLIVDHYSGDSQARALGWLSGARSLSLAPAFLIAGAMATWSDWRLMYVVLLVLAACVYFISRELPSREGRLPRASISRSEAGGLALIALAMLLIGVGSDSLSRWGVLRARPAAPFSVFELSPALLAIVGGILLIKLVLVLAHRPEFRACGPIRAAGMLGSAARRPVLLSIFTIAAVSSGVTFLIPLYIEIVQGRSSLYTAVALVPFTATSFLAAISVGRLIRRVQAAQVVRYAFLTVACGLAILGATVRNDWSDLSVVVSLMMIGLGEGALATILFKSIVASAPQDIVEELTPLCDATGHFAAAVGAALAGALLAGILSISVHRHLSVDYSSAGLHALLDLERVSFISNDRLQQVLGRTAATPEQVAEAVRINTEARLFALKLSFFSLAALTLVGFLPAARAERITRHKPTTQGSGGTGTHTGN